MSVQLVAWVHLYGVLTFFLVSVYMLDFGEGALREGEKIGLSPREVYVYVTLSLLLVGQFWWFLMPIRGFREAKKRLTKDRG